MNTVGWTTYRIHDVRHLIFWAFLLYITWKHVFRRWSARSQFCVEGKGRVLMFTIGCSTWWLLCWFARFSDCQLSEIVLCLLLSQDCFRAPSDCYLPRKSYDSSQEPHCGTMDGIRCNRSPIHSSEFQTTSEARYFLLWRVSCILFWHVFVSLGIV